MLDTSYRTAYNDDHEAFRDTVRKVFAEHMTPYLDQHEEEGIVPRSAWKALGEAGMLCPTVKEENGGLGLDFGFNCVLCEELSYLGSSAGFTLQNDITANYIERLGTEEQRAKYLAWETDHQSKVNKATVIVAKNRQGSTGNVPLSFIAEFTKFGDLAYGDGPEEY